MRGLRLTACSLGLWLLAASASQAGLPSRIPDYYAPSAKPSVSTGYDPYAQMPTAGSYGYGQLSGVVVDSAGKPLPRAEVQLQCGLDVYTNPDGSFFLNNVPAGEQDVRIMKSGYKMGFGKVHIVAGTPRTLKVALSPASSVKQDAAQPRYGNFTVVGKALHYGPKDRRVWVYKIETNEVNNLSHSWDNTWWDDVGDSSYELTCDNAMVGHRYRIKITWRNHRNKETSNDWEVQFNTPGESFVYDSPTDY